MGRVKRRRPHDTGQDCRAARRRVEEEKAYKPLDLVMMEALACAESLRAEDSGKGDSNSLGTLNRRCPVRVYHLSVK